MMMPFVRGDNNPLYHRSNTKIDYVEQSPNAGLVNHASNVTSPFKMVLCGSTRCTQESVSHLFLQISVALPIFFQWDETCFIIASKNICNQREFIYLQYPWTAHHHHYIWEWSQANFSIGSKIVIALQCALNLWSFRSVELNHEVSSYPHEAAMEYEPEQSRGDCFVLGVMILHGIEHIALYAGISILVEIMLN